MAYRLPTQVDRWEVAWSDKHARWYFQDRLQGTSSWSRPPGCSLDLPQAPPAQAPTRNAEELPPGWESNFDVNTKRRYYFNRETKARSWEHPAQAKPSTRSASREVNREANARPRGAAPPNSTRQDNTASSRDRNVPGPRGGNDFVSNTEGASRRELGGYSARRGPTGGGSVPPPAWDAKDWLYQFGEARGKSDGKRMRFLLREVSENNYVHRHLWPVPRTVAVSSDSILNSNLRPGNKACEVSFSQMTTMDAVLYFARAGRRVSALNYANGDQVGGGYKTGAQAQEEDCCRRMPPLYTSLYNAQREKLYPFGPGTCKSASVPHKYSEVLWTPSCTVARAGQEEGFAFLSPKEQAQVSIVSAAAPNIRFANPPHLYDTILMYNTVRSILMTPPLKQPEIDTLILGAWGCGAFGGDPQDVSELFCKALRDERLGTFFREVHFAIPNPTDGTKNGDVFRDVFRKNGISFREVSPTSR